VCLLIVEQRTAYNMLDNNAPSFEMDYSCRSIVPLRVLVEKVILSSRHNGVVGDRLCAMPRAVVLGESEKY